MEAQPLTITNHLNAFIQLKTAYGNNGKPMQDFIIAQEPRKENFSKQHDIWNRLRHSDLLNYIELSESEKIITYAEEHHVVPFISDR